MNLTELKQKPIGELIETAQEMGLENVSRTRKQDIIFVILKKHAKNGEDIYGDGMRRFCRMALAFCAPLIHLISPDRTSLRLAQSDPPF